MAYTTHPNGCFLTRPGNWQIGKRIIDEEITMTRFIDTSTDNLSNAAYYKIWAVPAGFCLLEARIIVHTAEGAAETCDIVDDDSSTTTFINDADLNTTNGVVTTGARVYYASAGFICILANADLTATKFWVQIKGQILSTSM